MAYKIKSKKAKEKKTFAVKKRKVEYNIMYNVGEVKYLVNYYTGKKYKDGSKFYDIATFKNKKKMEKFINSLEK